MSFGEDWIKIDHNSKIEIGPLKMTAQLSEIAQDADEASRIRLQRFNLPVVNSWKRKRLLMH